ncbi:zinc ribbon domain-containing protein [Vibrio sp. PP-XX7]
MSDRQCPQCAETFIWDGQYYCSQCQHHYKKTAYCPDCQAELEKLSACGAVSYFCNSCNELKSKSNPKTRFEYQLVD